MTSTHGNHDLAETARDAARQSSGIGRRAWLCGAVACDQSRSVTGARRVLAEMEPGEIQSLAIACLLSLTSDAPVPNEPDPTTEESTS